MNRESLFVTVIIPVYNGENFIAGAIKNILEQNYASLEIIIIDDGSTDGAAEVITGFNKHVRYVYQPNRGPAAARNRGIRIASGDVIAFLDVDDRWSRNALHRQARYLASNPSVDIVQGLIQKMRFDAPAEDGELIFKPSSSPYRFINLGSALYRKSVFDKVGLFDETLRYNEDTDWFFRAWEHNISKAVLDEVTLFYRIHDGNMTHGVNLPHSGLIPLFKKHLERCRLRGGLQTTPRSGLRSLSEYIGWSGMEEGKGRYYD